MMPGNGYKLKPCRDRFARHYVLSINSRLLPRDGGPKWITEIPNPRTPTASSRRLHPLIATAAGAVIIASLAATAAITGLFPKASSNGSQNRSDAGGAGRAATASSIRPRRRAKRRPTASSAASATASSGSTSSRSAAPTSSLHNSRSTAGRSAATAAAGTAGTAQPYAQQQPSTRNPAYCSTCGTVEAISAVRQEGQGTGIGAVGGAVAGGVVGNQFGTRQRPHRDDAARRPRRRSRR